MWYVCILCRPGPGTERSGEEGGVPRNHSGSNRQGFRGETGTATATATAVLAVVLLRSVWLLLF